MILFLIGQLHGPQNALAVQICDVLWRGVPWWSPAHRMSTALFSNCHCLAGMIKSVNSQNNQKHKKERAILAHDV